MTPEQIERLIWEANPVPDVNALEPLDVSLLVLEPRRRTDMPSNDRVETEPGTQKRRTGTLTGVTAAALLVIGGLVAIGLLNREPVAAPTTTAVTTTTTPATTTTDAPTTTALAGPKEAEMFPAGQGPGTTLTLSLPEGWRNLGWGVLRGSTRVHKTSLQAPSYRRRLRRIGRVNNALGPSFRGHGRAKQ